MAGGHLLGRWQRSYSEDADLALGRDLLEKSHPEFSAFFVDTLPTETQRSAYVYLSWNFRAE